MYLLYFIVKFICELTSKDIIFYILTSLCITKNPHWGKYS